jgi:hypothetical protein
MQEGEIRLDKRVLAVRLEAIFEGVLTIACMYAEEGQETSVDDKDCHALIVEPIVSETEPLQRPGERVA